MKLIPILTALFIGIQAHASTCQLPSEISNEVSKSIFQIVPINSYAAHMSVDRAREIYQETCQTDSPLLHERLNCEVLKTCENEETCVREYSPHGTAFMAGGKLTTAWHVVYSTHSTALLFLQNHLSNLSREELNKKLSVLKPQFVLYNKAGIKVFDTRDSSQRETTYHSWGDPLSTIYSNNGLKRNLPYGHYENIPEDYVFINLPHQIGPDLMIAKEKTSCIFSAGFAFDGSSTKYQINGGEESSIKDRQKHLSHLIPFQITPQDLREEEFYNLSEEEALKLMGFDEASIQSQIEKYGRDKIRQSINTVYKSHLRHMRDQKMDSHSKVHIHKGEVYPGQSGGPLLNEQGEVVGITTNGFINNQDGLKVSVGGAGFLF